MPSEPNLDPSQESRNSDANVFASQGAAKPPESDKSLHSSDLYPSYPSSQENRLPQDSSPASSIKNLFSSPFRPITQAFAPSSSPSVRRSSPASGSVTPLSPLIFSQASLPAASSSQDPAASSSSQDPAALEITNAALQPVLTQAPLLLTPPASSPR